MRPDQKRSAFTLVELLVVISIVALLIALLLPALGAAREQARVSLCQNQLRQIAVGITAYANDFGGLVPPAGWYQTHPVQVGRQWYPWVPERFDPITNKTYPKAGIGLALYPYYLPSYNIFYCPDVIGQSTYSSVAIDYYWSPTPDTCPYITSGGTTPEFLQIGYWYAAGWATSGMANFSYPAFQCQARIDELNLILMQDIFCQDYTTYQWEAAHPQPAGGSGSGSFAFTDGHVKLGSPGGNIAGSGSGTWVNNVWAVDQGGAGVTEAYAVR